MTVRNSAPRRSIGTSASSSSSFAHVLVTRLLARVASTPYTRRPESASTKSPVSSARAAMPSLRRARALSRWRCLRGSPRSLRRRYPRDAPPADVEVPRTILISSVFCALAVARTNVVTARESLGPWRGVGAEPRGSPRCRSSQIEQLVEFGLVKPPLQRYPAPRRSRPHRS